MGWAAQPVAPTLSLNPGAFGEVMKYYVMFRASSGRFAFLVSPTVFGEIGSKYQPWIRAEHRATLFPNKMTAIAARDALLTARGYEAPELNKGLEQRLQDAVFVSVSAEDAATIVGNCGIVTIKGQEVMMVPLS
jgi:hypothetical protein